MIPNWTMAGIVPPIRPGEEGHSIDRSPYRVSLEVVVERFATSGERATILEGFLKFRTALYHHGITNGFQWVDGSFLENVEDIESRPPNDIDVVTFFFLPDGQSQESFFPSLGVLANKAEMKRLYLVDSFFAVLGKPLMPNSVRSICYWYSLWSHRRDETWKGFVEIELNPLHDEQALLVLSEKIALGFGS